MPCALVSSASLELLIIDYSNCTVDILTVIIIRLVQSSASQHSSIHCTHLRSVCLLLLAENKRIY